MYRSGFRLPQFILRDRQRTPRNIVRLIVPVNDLDRNGGSIKQLLIICIGREQTALDGTFQEQHNNQNIRHRQIAVIQAHTVTDPEQCCKRHDQDGHFLQSAASGNPALQKHHNHKIETHYNEPAHYDVIDPVVTVFQIEIDESIVEHEYLLVQVIGKYKGKKNSGRNQKIIQFGRMDIILWFPQVIDNESTQCGNKQHTHIKTIPQVAHQGVGHTAGKIPLYNFINEPKKHQTADCQHQPPYIFIHQATVQGYHPHKQK